MYTLQLGDHIICHSNKATFENERGTINNHARVTAISQDWPGQTKTHPYPGDTATKYKLLKKGTQLATHFPTATTDTWRQCENIFKLLIENKGQPRILRPARCWGGEPYFCSN